MRVLRAMLKLSGRVAAEHHPGLGRDLGCFDPGRVAGFPCPFAVFSHEARVVDQQIGVRRGFNRGFAWPGVSGDRDRPAQPVFAHHLIGTDLPLPAIDFLAVLEGLVIRTRFHTEPLCLFRIEPSGTIVLQQRIAECPGAVFHRECLDLVVVMRKDVPRFQLFRFQVVAESAAPQQRDRGAERGRVATDQRGDRYAAARGRVDDLVDLVDAGHKAVHVTDGTAAYQFRHLGGGHWLG